MSDRPTTMRCVLKNAARSIVHDVRAARRAITGRLSVMTAGFSPVSGSCQIPNLRELLLSNGLPSTKGVFVEVGAFDGESFSNTSFLADQGWRGLYVEPIREFARRTQIRHAFNDIAIERVAIAADSGTAQINKMGPLSTLEDLGRLDGIAWATPLVTTSEAISIKTERLGAILDRNTIPKHFDLLVVDVEGGERPIVEALFRSDWRARAMIVELSDEHPDFVNDPVLQEDHRQTRAAIRGEGYGEVYRDEINTVFMRA